ncbi:MAG: RHS repeat protein [Prevotellaceae bacterium]|jgi:hypothetical protein|nr:RHS repeat protein [Prevotellaceae bacterium]
MKRPLFPSIYCLLLLYWTFPLLMAQDAVPNLLSSQTRDFFHTVSHYTGTVNMSIPLYVYKDRDFEIPISLSYNASGFIPSKREGPVGLNWALNAGGAVVRKVNGLPDDSNGKKQNGERVSPMGLWTGIKENKMANLNKQDIFTLTVGEERDGVWATGSDVELSPDEFSFVAPGLSGWFFINFDGTIKCGGDRPFVVNLDGMGKQPAKGTTVVYSTILITADNGYNYVFGGDNAEKEYSIHYPKETTDSIAVLTAWHLKRIVAPNGRTVEYNYRPFNRKNDYLYNVLIEQEGEAESTGYNSFIAVHPPKGIAVLKNISKTVYLDNITIDSTVIQCSYSEKDFQFYGGLSPNVFYGPIDLKLDRITVANNQKEITRFLFSFNYSGSAIKEYPRLFLSTVSEQGLLSYVFDYYSQQVYPDPSTCNIDYWGFLTSQLAQASLIPEATFNWSDFTYTGSERSPDSTYFQLGLLKSISYPTKGKTTFFYEPNKYTRRLERRNSGNYFPALYAINGFTGGARILAVENTNGATIQRTSYSYPAGGILMNWPTYYRTYLQDTWLAWFDVRKFFAQSYSYAVNHYPGEPFIHYPEVIETKSSGEGYVHYKYTNYLDRPDIADFRRKTHANTDGLSSLTMWTNLQVLYSSRYFERGLLTDRLVYNASNQLVEKSHFEYSGIADYPDKWIAGLSMGYFQVYSYKIYHCPIGIKTETHSQYLNGEAVTTTVNYTYNTTWNNAYPATQTTTGGDGTQIKTLYHYIDGPRDNAPYAAMRAKNIRNIPVETITYKNDAVVAASLINFRPFPEISSNRWNIYPSEVLALETTAPITDYDTETIDSRLKVKMTCERYDDFGNVLQQRDEDGITVSYLWSYNGLHKLAEAVGATYQEVQAAVGNMNLAPEVPDAAYLNNMQLLRNSLPQALITNYTYKPLVGLTSQTGPNGLITYYEYDELNRLKTVRDHERNVVKEYGYYYHEQNN